MPSLKDLKNRIGSVKNTQKITKAMKMVAASKLRRAKENAEAARPYAEHMGNILRSLAAHADPSNAPLLLKGTGKQDTHLLVVMSSDRGLCGGFNGSIVRAARYHVALLEGEGKKVRIFCVGRKGYEQIKAWRPDLIAARATDIGKPKLDFTAASVIAEQMLMLFEQENCDTCTIIYNRFKSAISQIVTLEQLIPLELPETSMEQGTQTGLVYEYEPEEEVILNDLLRRNLTVQVFHGLLENAASEQGARMTAMDNATRNAGDMIKRLSLQYNRTRQAAITKELIEIISGAEAL